MDSNGQLPAGVATSTTLQVPWQSSPCSVFKVKDWPTIDLKDPTIDLKDPTIDLKDPNIDLKDWMMFE